MKRVRFFNLWVALAMLVCIATVWAQSKGIDPALLAKAKAGDADAEEQVSRSSALSAVATAAAQVQKANSDLSGTMAEARSAASVIQ